MATALVMALLGVKKRSDEFPHPLVWKAINALGLVYGIAIWVAAFVDVSTMRRFFTHFDGDVVSRTAWRHRHSAKTHRESLFRSTTTARTVPSTTPPSQRDTGSTTSRHALSPVHTASNQPTIAHKSAFRELSHLWSCLTSSRTERRVRHLRRGALFRLVVEDVHAARLRRLDVALGAVRGGRDELAALVPELQGVLVGQSILALTFSRLATRNNAVHPRPRALQRTRDCRRVHHPEAAPPSPFRLLRLARWNATQCSGLSETCSIWHCSFVIGIFIYSFVHHSLIHIHSFESI